MSEVHFNISCLVVSIVNIDASDLGAADIVSERVSHHRPRWIGVIKYIMCWRPRSIS